MSLGPDLLLDESGDLDLTSGDLQLVASVSQAIGLRLRYFRGEWFRDLERGVPYYEAILRKQPNLAHVQQILRAVVRQTPGVSEVLALTVNLTDRRGLEVTWRAVADVQEIAGGVVL